MKQGSRRSVAAGVCAGIFAALALVGTGPAIAARSDPLPPPVFSEEAATAIDAATIAAMEGISQAQAKGVIARQAAIGEVIPRLEAILGSASAGIAVDAPEESTTLNVVADEAATTVSSLARTSSSPRFA